MTHVKALQAGHSSQGTSDPITPAQLQLIRRGLRSGDCCHHPVVRPPFGIVHHICRKFPVGSRLAAPQNIQIRMTLPHPATINNIPYGGLRRHTVQNADAAHNYHVRPQTDPGYCEAVLSYTCPLRPLSPTSPMLWQKWMLRAILNAQLMHPLIPLAMLALDSGTRRPTFNASGIRGTPLRTNMRGLPVSTELGCKYWIAAVI